MRLPSQEDLLGSGDPGGDEEEMDEEAWAAQEAERERRACRSSADSQPLIDFSNVATLQFRTRAVAHCAPYPRREAEEALEKLMEAKTVTVHPKSSGVIWFPITVLCSPVLYSFHFQGARRSQARREYQLHNGRAAQARCCTGYPIIPTLGSCPWPAVEH